MSKPLSPHQYYPPFRDRPEVYAHCVRMYGVQATKRFASGDFSFTLRGYRYLMVHADGVLLIRKTKDKEGNL